MIGRPGSVLWAPSMIWSERSSSVPWHATSEHVDVTALERPDGVVDTVGDPDELEVRVVGHGSLHVEGVQAFDGDECADGRSPWCSYFLSCDVISCESCWVDDRLLRWVLRIAGRPEKEPHGPVSEASASV